MRMVNARVGTVIRSAVAGALLLALGASAGAQVAGTDEAAGYIVFPKVVVDSSAQLGFQTDTLIQITNTDLVTAHAMTCTWVNATSRCGLPLAGCPAGSSGVPGTQGAACDTSANCASGLQCVPCWSEIDFNILITPGQPIAFYASQGQTIPRCFGFQDPDPGCLTANVGGILAVPSDPFRGELKCVQVRGANDDRLDNRNDLKGEATIISGTNTSLQSAAYNAFGFQTAAGAPGTDADAPLCLGGTPPLANPCGDGACGLEYAGCPGVLILNHFFEFAPDPLGLNTPPLASYIRTSLTLTPCTEAIFSGDDINDQLITTAQMLIFNEFEQRYSSSTRVQCYKDIPLADIDTRPGPGDDIFSVFAVGVSGTLTGQTRIRGVSGDEDTVGHGLIGVAHESHFFSTPASPTDILVDTAAFDLHTQGEREQGDAVCRQ